MNATCKYLLFASLVVFGHSLPANATEVTHANVCTALKAAIHSAEMDASDALAEKLSATRIASAALDQEIIVASYTQMQDNLILMEQHRCKPLDHPVGAHVYLGNAVVCYGDEIKARMSSSKRLPASCDRSTWKPFASPAPGVSHDN